MVSEGNFVALLVLSKAITILENSMNGIIYLVGLVVVVLLILSFFGLR
jgi:hypothetical protein